MENKKANSGQIDVKEFAKLSINKSGDDPQVRKKVSTEMLCASEAREIAQ